MKPGDLACCLTENNAPVLLLKKGYPGVLNTGLYPWKVILNGKEKTIWSDNLVLWEDRERENVRETQKE
jgi:hypothetical protein